MSKRLLQAVTAMLALVPLITGIIGMFGIDDPLYALAGLPRLPVLDSNMRFFGGVWFAQGIAILYLVPSIERQTVLFRVVWGAIFAGGIGRLLSMYVVGAPPLPFVGFTALEIIGAPLFVLWQARVARRYAPA